MKFFLIKKTTDNMRAKGKAIDNTMNNMGVNISKKKPDYSDGTMLYAS